MHRAEGGASAPFSSSASLEQTLDRAIESLVNGPQTREARALLIEARRLRSVIANWRSIPPPSDVRDEMLDRVVQLSTSVGAAFPQMRPETSAPSIHLPAGSGEEETEGYALDFEPQLYSLEAATHPNRQAIPLPQSPLPQSAFPSPEPAAPLSLPVPSEEEPTRAWNNASIQAPADLLEPSGPLPSPWPVDDLHDGGPSVVNAERVGSLPQQARSRFRQEPPPATSQALSLYSPDVETRPPAGARVFTYEFDHEGDDMSVPRTQITAHAIKLSEPINPLFVVLTDAYSSRADAYRTLRRKLATMPATRALGVTSAEHGEGKTVFAVNLALTLRENARSRVLIVEANLRTPSLGKMLGFDIPECFIEQLKRHADDPRAPWVVAELLPKLHVMAIDPRTPHEPLLDPVSFSMGMERLKQAGYEYVIVDSPPVLGNLDCNAISDSVDAMILTALPMKSKRRQMRKAVEQLEPAPVLGVVVLEA